MRLKDLGEDCELCPLLKEEICPGGWKCYGGEPIEPPCCSMEEDTDLDQWIANYYEQEQRYERYFEEKARKEREKKERAKKAADTRKSMQIYCSAEISALKRAKKQLEVQKSVELLASSLAEAVNITNEMFRYEDRVQIRPEISEAVKRLSEEVEQCKTKYDTKRKEFYKKRGEAALEPLKGAEHEN